MTRFVYRFQFIIDQIDDSIQLTLEHRSRARQDIDRIQDELKQLANINQRTRDSLDCLAESAIDRLETCRSAVEELRTHRIRQSGLIQRLEQIENDRRRLQRCLREQTDELAEIDARLAALRREHRQFELNRTTHEQQHLIDENQQEEKNIDDTGQMIWHRNRSD